ncbi:MAG TPA: flagellar hook capping FlgD N-terminal domain-containing protein [Verrucomicrobiae bacterium]|nr:flagellar hook capping FlgD N-terminal domain-containing protein [Verrucomicrobiae bacterium]
MSISSLTSATSTLGQTSDSTDSTSVLPQQTLDQSDFLNLLVTQLANQDPMNPMSDTDFVAQMANFTSLQQTKETYAAIQSLQANDLIGRMVVVQTDDGSYDSGTVSGVAMDSSGTPNIVVNGQPYALSAVQSVTAAPTNTGTQGVQQ